MLKFQVPFFFCSAVFVVALPTSANSGQPVDTGNMVSYTSSKKTSVKQHAISLVMPAKHKKFVASYLQENDEALGIVLRRSERPFEIMDSVFDHYGLPQELKYLAVIESELNPMALSRVGARGPWQLMVETAHDLGLKVSRRNDERTNFIKSTRAAALYLRDLHRTFGDWLLVLAAYNSGPRSVLSAIRTTHSHNFWALQQYLPKETRQHVKRFIATAYYFENIARENSNLAKAGKTLTPQRATIQQADLAFNGAEMMNAVALGTL